MANDTIEASKIKIRRDITENWNSVNPILDEGEIGIEWINTSTGVCKLKIGNGTSNWLDLPYFAGNNIPYDNITSASLPTINGIKVKGNLSLTELGIQPLGNYATNDNLDERLNEKANIDDVYPREYLDEKFLNYDSSQVPSTFNNAGKYLKVIEDENKYKMEWTNLEVEDIVTPASLEETLENYVAKNDEESMVNVSEYETLKEDVENIKSHNLDDMESDITDIAEELSHKVDESKLEAEYVDKTLLAKILTGDSSGETPYYENGYASHEELVSKANLNDLTDHTTNTNNPHEVTKAQIGLGNVDNTADLDKPISTAMQIALDGKRDDFEIGSGLGLIDGYLVNTAPNQNTDWNNIIGKPSTGEFQGDWNEIDASKLSYIRNKPEPYVLPLAEKETLGGIKLGEDFYTDNDGHLKTTVPLDHVNDYEYLINKPSFLAPKRYYLTYRGEVSNVDELYSITEVEIGDKYHVISDNLDYAYDVDEKWIVLTDYDRTIGYLTDPSELVEYPFIGKMTATDLNLASLTVAKAIDERLEEEKADKTALEELEALVYAAIPSAGTVYTKDECDNRFVNIDNYSSDMMLKADKDNVYTKAETYPQSYIDSKFSTINYEFAEFNTNKEDLINKTQTIHGLIEDELETKYTSAGAVKEITDELQEDYNEKITAETNRATARENAIEEDLHTNYYTKPEVDTLISSVYKFKGTVENYYELPTENNVEGDVWNIINADENHGIKAGDNVAWVDEKDGVEAHWDVLAGLTDLSNYYNKEETKNKFVSKADYEEDMDELDSNLEEMSSEIEATFATKADKATTLAGYNIEDAYTKVDTEVLINNAVNNKAEQAEVDAITAPMIYRGSVETFSDLPSEDNNLYDLYTVTSTRENYSWDGETWIRQKSLEEKADKADTYSKDDINENFATITLVNTKANQADFSAHINNYNNPHQVTKAQVGLGNCDNTSDLNKPISNATQQALNLKQNQLTPTQLTAVDSGITAEKVASYDVISDNYDNLATKTELEVVNDLAELNAATLLDKADKANTYTKTEIDNKLSAAMHFKGTVATVSALPSSGQEIGDMYNVAEDGTNYAWDGNQWDKLSETIDLTVYYTKTEIDGKVSQINTAISSVDSDLQSQINTKQPILTAGANLKIENNVISTTFGDGGTLYDKTSQLINDAGFITIDDVPDVYDATLTIQQNGSDLGTFSANSNTNTLVNIIVPTRMADLSDGASYTPTTSLGAAALSNNYIDLDNKPTIGSGILTITRNNLSLGTFNANSTNDNTINIEVPTTVASLTDSSNYALKTDIQTYTAGAGISIDENNVISNTRISAEWGNISGDITTQTDLQDALDDLETLINEKQGNLTAGDNITIENGVISAEKTKITFKDWTI